MCELKEKPSEKDTRHGGWGVPLRQPRDRLLYEGDPAPREVLTPTDRVREVKPSQPKVNMREEGGFVETSLRMRK